MTQRSRPRLAIWTQRSQELSAVAPTTMKTAKSYDEWKAAAQQKDQETGRDLWRRADESDLYDYALVRRRLDELHRLRRTGDDIGLYFALQEGIHGNFGGMGRAPLYQKSAFGTKKLITDYVDTVTENLEHLASDDVTAMSFDVKLDFFRRASLCFGHTSLMLSGSGSNFFFHIGVLRALVKEGLLPRILSGSSGGAMVAAVVGSRAPEHVDSALTTTHFRDFIKDSSDKTPAKNLRQEAMQRQSEILDHLLPDLTFVEAHRVSGIWVNISVAPTEVHQSSRLLNAITSPHVYMRESLLASAAIPGVFPAVTLAAKNENGDRQLYLPHRKWVDGSMSDDLPAKRLARLYGVNHYIVSQTNPHVLPFVTDAKIDNDPLSIMKRTAQRTARELLNGGAALLHRPLRYTPLLKRGVNGMLSVINQDYLGDINIIPPPGLVTPFKVLAFRTIDEATALIHAGEQATWPKMEMIRTQTKVSRTLDRILKEYEDRRSERQPPATALAEGDSPKRRWFFF